MAKVVTAALDRYPIYEVYSPYPAHLRGVIMRRLGGGAGRRRDRRTGPSIRQPAPGNSGPRTGAASAGEPQAHTRAASGLRPEVLWPPARSWLTAARKRAAESAARRRKENAAAERRKARRWAYPAGDLRRFRRSVRPRGGPRVRRSAPATVGALLT